MARRSYRKMTPEERARQEANQARLEQVLERRLERDGLTREEVWRRAGLADFDRPGQQQPRQ